jgi:phospholipid/cholesterol/gamma-HCH transport system substrate-binding protein
LHALDLKKTGANLESATARLDKIMNSGEVEAILAEFKNTLVKVQSLTTDIQSELHALDLKKSGANLESATARLDKIMNSGEVEAILAEARGTLVKMNQWVESVDRRSVAATNNLKATSENLRRASESLEMLIERVYVSPSDLLFGQPPPPRREK